MNLAQVYEPDEEGAQGLFESLAYQADGMGLAPSGGGCKATAYPLGALVRRNALGMLPKLSRMSSVSGVAANFSVRPWSLWINGLTDSAMRSLFGAAGSSVRLPY